MPSVLFVHNGRPGRFAPLARALKNRGWNGALINRADGLPLDGFSTIQWKFRAPSPKSAFVLVRPAEDNLRVGRAAAEAARQLRSDGFSPDIIIGHPGWGEMLFLDEIFPTVPQIQIGELYYRTLNSDVDFDPEFAATFDMKVLARAKNLGLAASYLNATRIVCPTRFQADTLPEVLQPRISIIHEGIDTSVARRRSEVVLRVTKRVALDGSVPVITFINRHFEPMRGFHVFMRALPRLLRELPTAHVLLIGSDARSGYGPAAGGGRTWKEVMLDEIGDRIDPARVHFVGVLAYDKLIDVLSASTAHVYMTYPFVLSWSLLDAMACECVVIGSDTAPVREVVDHRQNGLLVDFFNPTALADAVIDVCRRPAEYAGLRVAARKSVIDRFDRATVCEPAWLRLIDEVIATRSLEERARTCRNETPPFEL